MSTKHVRTAADLIRFKCALRVECGRCGYSMTLEGYELARSARTNLELHGLASKLKCSRCGGKEATVSVLSPPPTRH